MHLLAAAVLVGFVEVVGIINTAKISHKDFA